MVDVQVKHGGKVILIGEVKPKDTRSRDQLTVGIFQLVASLYRCKEEQRMYPVGETDFLITCR